MGIIGIDPRVRGWTGQAITATGAIVETRDLKGPTWSGPSWLRGMAAQCQARLLVIEDPEEMSRYGRQYFAQLQKVAEELREQGRELRLQVLMVTVTEIRAWAQMNGLLLRGAINEDRAIRAWLERLNYSCRRGGPLGNADQRDAMVAALYGKSRLEREAMFDSCPGVGGRP